MMKFLIILVLLATSKAAFAQPRAAQNGYTNAIITGISVIVVVGLGVTAVILNNNDNSSVPVSIGH